MGGTASDKFKYFKQNTYKEDQTNTSQDIAAKITRYLYVSAQNGDDNNNGETPDKPMRSLQKAINEFPSTILEKCYVILTSTGTYDSCIIKNKNGVSDALTISGYPSNPRSCVITGSTLAFASQVNFFGVTFTVGDQSWRVQGNSAVYFYDCVLNFQSASYAALLVWDNSRANVVRSEIHSGAIIGQCGSTGLIVVDGTFTASSTNNNSWVTMFGTEDRAAIKTYNNFAKVSCCAGSDFIYLGPQSSFEGTITPTLAANYNKNKKGMGSNIQGYATALARSLTSNYTIPTVLCSEDFYNISTTAAGPVTLTLPSNPQLFVGRSITVTDDSGCASLSSIVVAGNGKMVGMSSAYTITTNSDTKTFTYNGSRWFVK